MATPKLKSAIDALKPLPDIEYTVEGVIAEGTVGVLVGESGDGKSYAMMYAGVCVPWVTNF